MPPKKKQKDCLIILVNVGRTSTTQNGNESFLEKAKLVMKLMIQRKIFLRPKDETGVILMGASETKNNLAYDNIVELDSLKVSTWDLVEKIMKLESTNEKANWVDSMEVLIDYVKRECIERNTTTTVCLLTDFQEESDVIKQYDINVIATEIKNAEIHLLAVTSKSLTGDTQIELNPSEELFANLCNTVQGATMTFDDTIPKLTIYKDIPKNPMPWKIEMNLYDITIPIIFYLRITDDFKLPKWQLSTETETKEKLPVTKNRVFVDSKKTEISEDCTTKGYLYGRKLIPFSDVDKEELMYQSGPAGFMIYGFTKQQDVTLDCLSGKGSYVVVPVQKWASPFYSLVKAMADSKKVAIVRRVFRKNAAPKMGVLFPKLNIPDQPWCLVYVELVFAEDRRIVQVKPLKSTMNQLSCEQTNAIDDLIDSMMLTEIKDEKTNEEQEAFAAGAVHDVSRQHIWDKLAHRALNPDAPLPPISDFLKKILEPPNPVQVKSEPVLKVIESLFPVKPVEKEEKKGENYKKIIKNSDESRINFEDAESTSADTNISRKETDVKETIDDLKAEEEELSLVTEAVERASQAIDVDLDELAKNM